MNSLINLFLKHIKNKVLGQKAVETIATTSHAANKSHTTIKYSIPQ